MKNLLFVCWNREEAEERAFSLRDSGYEIRIHSDQTAGAAGLGFVKQTPPEIVVVDLGRLPSQGRATATWLRQRKITRHIPIIFVGGTPEKVARTRAIIPDAVYAEWKNIHSALRRAVKTMPAKPVVPGTMDEYAGVSLVRKLGITKDSVVALLGAPAGFKDYLVPLPPGVRLITRARGTAQVIVLFVQSQADLKRRFPAARKIMAEGGRLWIAWPKQGSGTASDLTQITVRRFGLDAGLVDYKITAIDATWSGLLFARRKNR